MEDVEEEWRGAGGPAVAVAVVVERGERVARVEREGGEYRLIGLKGRPAKKKGQKRDST